MKFSNDKIHHRKEINPNIYNAFFQYHPKYNSITSLKENTKQNYELNGDEEYYLVQNQISPIAQMKSVSLRQNKNIYQKNGILSRQNLNDIMNKYINSSVHKRKKIKMLKSKKEENKENKENKDYYNKKGLKKIYMEHLIKEGIMVDVKNLKKVKQKSFKDKLTQRKKNFLIDLGIGYGSNHSSKENIKNNKENINEINYYKDGNDKKYFNTLSNFYSTNTKKIKYYSPNHNNITNLHLNKVEISSDKSCQKIKKPKINQFEYIHKIKKEINKIKTEPNNFLSVQTKSPKSTINNKCTSSKLTKTLTESFRQKNKKIKKRIYSATINNTKDKKINLKRVGKKFINLRIKTKNDNFLEQKKTHRSPEELHYYIKNKKITRKKKEAKNRDKAYRDLFHKFKNLCTLNFNFSPKNSNKGNNRKQSHYYSPNSYNTISIMTIESKNSNKEKKLNNTKVLLGNLSKKNLNSTLIDANEYYLNILESKKMIRNRIYNKTEFNFNKNKYQNEESKSNAEEKNIKNLFSLNNKKNSNKNKDIIKKISKKIIDVLIKAKNVFSEGENANKEKNDIKEEKNIFNEEKKLNKDNNDEIKIKKDEQKDEVKNKKRDNFIEEHNNKIQISYDFENKNIKKEEKTIPISKAKNNQINEEKKDNAKLIVKRQEKNVEKIEKNIDRPNKNENKELKHPNINNYSKNKDEEAHKKVIDANKIANLIKITENIIKRLSFKKLYKYYIQIVIIENYFIGIKYIIAICKKFSFSKLKRNLYNDKIFKALKDLIFPFIRNKSKEFFIKLKQIPKKKFEFNLEDINEKEKNEKIEDNINLNLNDILLEEKNKNDVNLSDDSLSELYKNCPNTINQPEDNNKENNKIEKNKGKNELVFNKNKDNINNIPNPIESNDENINDVKNISEEKKINQNIDKMTEEIIQNLLLSEITSKEAILIPKKKFKYKMKLKNIRGNSSSSSTDNIINDNKLLDLSNLSKLSLSDDNLSALNDSIMEAYTQKSYFYKTIIDKKKLFLIKFYQIKIAPKFIDLIKQEIISKYDRIYKNISAPYGNNSKELMMSLILQDADMLRDNFKVQKYDESIADIIDKEKLLKQFEPINIKIRENWQNKENKKNQKANELMDDYLKYDQYMNKCLLDCAIELINCERKYGENGNPLIWSSRTRELEFKYPEKDPTKLVNYISRNILKFLKQKNGLICDNYENLPGEIISEEREKRLINTIKSELEDGDYLWRNLEMEETQLKVEVSDCIVDQLYNEVVEILEHIQLSRKFGELYHYKSIYACDEMPKLGFQQTTTTENGDNDENNDNDNNILFNKS